MELLKLLNTSEIAAQVINFLLLLFLLRVFLWKRVLGFIDQRREKIASEFRQIEDTRACVEELKSKYNALLAAAGEAAEAKMKEILGLAQKEALVLKEQARSEAAKIIEEARKEIGYELAKSKEELKNSMVELVIGATGKIMLEKLTPGQDRRLIEEFLENSDQLQIS